jgi:glycosyltransferase involved in cell wall biosynthesis
LPSPLIAMFTPHGDPLGRIGEPDIGGQCVYIRELAKHLSAMGVSTVSFTRDRGEGKPPVERFAPHASVVRIPCGPRGFVPKEQLLPHLDEFADGVAPYLQADEVFHSHYWDGGYVASRLRNDHRWFHSTHSLGRIKQLSLPDASRYQYDDRIRIEEMVYRGCDRVFALTSIEREQINTHYGVPERQILVIPPGVDTGLFRPRSDASVYRSALGLPERTTVLTLGRLDERKGLDLFVRAAGHLRAQLSEGAPSFVMSAGEGASDRTSDGQSLSRLIQELSLGPAVTWRPVVSETDLPSYYNAADLFVLPSRYEPFGIVMLEAMASGIPVVATRNGGPATVIEHGRDGLLGDPEDVASFAALLRQLTENPQQREAFGRQARIKVEAQYAWTVIADRFSSAYTVSGEEGRHAR